MTEHDDAATAAHWHFGSTQMAKALLGTHMAPRTVMLIDEVRVLRARVAQLEAELAEAKLARELLDDEVLDLRRTPQQAVSA